MAQYDLITFNNKEYYDMIPDATGWKGDEYEITASSSWSSKYSAWQIFNKDKGGSRWASNGISNQWIEIHLVNKVKINAIAMKSSNYYPEVTSPKTFKIWGSNDGKEYTLLKTINDSKQWSSKEIRIYELNETYKFSYLKITFDENWGDDEEIDFNELYYLLSKDCCYYLINDNGIYKNYNEETNSLVEVTDTSILNENALNNICIYNLNKIKDIINLKQPGVKIVSNKKFKATISSLKTNKQLIIANGDFSTKLAANIDYFKFNYEIAENCIIKTVISINSGLTWYSYINGEWTLLNSTTPSKKYENLNISEKQQLNTFLDEIIEKGINVQDVEKLNFNLLNSKKLRFAYAIQVANPDSVALLKDLKWQFDSIGFYEQLSPKTDVNISITNEAIKIQPLKNMELIKINVSTPSQFSQPQKENEILNKFNINDNNKLTWNNSILYTEEDINALNIKATNIIVNIKNGDNEETKTLQEVLNDILANGIQSQQTRAVCGTAICGITTCGDL